MLNIFCFDISSTQMQFWQMSCYRDQLHLVKEEPLILIQQETSMTFILFLIFSFKNITCFCHDIAVNLLFLFNNSNKTIISSFMLTISQKISSTSTFVQNLIELCPRKIFFLIIKVSLFLLYYIFTGHQHQLLVYPADHHHKVV